MCELGCGLRSVVEESSLDLDNRHLSLLIDKFFLLERRRTALANSHRGSGGLIQIPDLGKRLLGTRCCTSV